MTQQLYSVWPLGDCAITLSFTDVIDEAVNRKVLAIACAIKESSIEGIKDIVPAYSSLTVHYDVIAVRKRRPGKPAFETLKETLETLLLQQPKDSSAVSRRLNIPVCYSPKYGLDLNDLVKRLNLSAHEIIQLHISRIYRVYMIGFLPGFAYMGEVDDRIAVARKQEPRLKIEAGFVGIAGKQTGIYPLTSPGGWQIIGRTPVKLFDKNKEEPVLFAAGDEVEFYSITEDEFDNY